MSASQTTAPRLYFVNGPIDFLLVGGASIALMLVFWATGTQERSPSIISAALWLAWVVNWPHFSATSYRLYHSTENIRQYPITAIAVPLLMVVAVIASLRFPLAVAPAFVKLFLLWSPYHFSGQTLGITMLYARRAGLQITPVERYAFSAFIFGTFFFPSIAAEVGSAPRPYFGVYVPPFGLPQWVAQWAPYGNLVTGLLLAAVIARWVVRLRRVPPLIVFLPACAQFVWFVPFQPSFKEFVPFFHSLQYLLIAWSMNLKERLDESGARPSSRFVLDESARWMLINFFGGVALFWLLPRVGMGAGFAKTLAEPVIIAAVQIHHFFVDGVIWKLKNPRVGSPLLVHLDELLGRSRAPRPAGA